MTLRQAAGGQRGEIVSGNAVIQKLHRVRDEAGGIGDRGIVGGLEGGIDGRKAERPGVQAAARSGNRPHREKVVVHIGVLVRRRIGGAIVVYRAIVGADLNRMPSLNQGKIVHRVVHRDVDDAGRVGSAIRARAEGIHVGEREVIVVGGSLVGIALPNEPIPQVVYHRVRDAPYVAGGNSLRVVVARGIRRRRGWKLLGADGRIVLKIPAHKQTLPGAQVVIYFGDVGAQLLRRRRRKRVGAKIVAVTQLVAVRQRKLAQIR